MHISDLQKKFSKKRVAYIYYFYWLMLAYIIAALTFWFISLRSQSMEIINLKHELLSKNDTEYVQKIAVLQKEKKAKTVQYVGEGLTFLVLITAGAIFVFRMLRKQLNLSRQQHDFVMAVTHELKTPIAVTKLNLETILKRSLSDEQQKRLLKNTLVESERLNALCNNMLLLNDTVATPNESQERFLLNDLLVECIEEQNNRLYQRKILLHIDDDIYITTDKTLLKLAVNNLLDNAQKYSPKETPITVNSFTKDRTIFIEVVDQGKGVKKEEEKNIFRKYYRSEDNKAKGTGLGLYVTRRIIKQNGGKLKYRPNIPSGSIFSISFAV